MMTFEDAIKIMENTYEGLYISLDWTRYTDGDIRYKACVLLNDEAVFSTAELSLGEAVNSLNEKVIKHFLKAGEAE